jgi:hypothetical protein
LLAQADQVNIDDLRKHPGEGTGSYADEYHVRLVALYLNRRLCS